MSERYLAPIYNAVFNEDFSYNDFDKRMKMQKAVYLLEQMGLNIGGYGYIWYKYGPYSQQLQDDMYHADVRNNADIEFSPIAKQDINKLRDMLNRGKEEDIPYDLPRWIECLASLYFLKENVLSSCASEERILSELEKRKNYLNSETANKIALECINRIYGLGN